MDLQCFNRSIDQSIKRARFLAKNNFTHWNTGDGVRMHLWLQKNGWPANEFVDLFMRCHLNFDSELDGFLFEVFLKDQYEWVSEDSVDALKRLVKTIDDRRFEGVDKDNLVPWVSAQLKGALAKR